MPTTKSKFGKPKSISVADFDAKFDAGEDISAHLDFSSARLIEPDTSAQKVNVDFPVWVVESLDKEAERIGIARQALIKLWIVERLEGASRGAQNEGRLLKYIIIDDVLYKPDASVAEIRPQGKRASHLRNLAGSVLEKRVIVERGTVRAVAASDLGPSEGRHNVVLRERKSTADRSKSEGKLEET
jgi:hypothetical protein